METILDVISEIEKSVNFNLELSCEQKRQFSEYLKDIKIKRLRKDKINLIFFGMSSTGKTSSLNLILYNFIKLNDLLNNFNNNEENEIITFPTSQSENTYFFTFIEKSENNKYEINLSFNEFEKKKLQTSKYFKNDIKENKIIKEFPYSLEGVNLLNNYLEYIFEISSELLEMIRKNEISQCRKENHRTPSKMIIKIPNFPNEYRMIDTPNMSLEIFGNDFLEILEGLYSMNFFILVQDIDSKTLYNKDREICKRISSDYSPAIFYSFLTKGESFIDKFNTINNRNQRDYEKSLRIIKVFFNFIEDFSKNPGIFFKKIIPIIDNSSSNDNVRNNVNNFINDVLHTKTLFNEQEFIDGLIKNKLLNYVKNNYGEKEGVLTYKETEEIQNTIQIILEETERELKSYFDNFNSFDDFKNQYPDFIYKLEEIYNRNEERIAEKFNRRNYIEQHEQYAFDDFLVIMLERPKRIIDRNLDSIKLNIREKTNNFPEEDFEEQNNYSLLNDTSNQNSGININYIHIIFAFVIIVGGFTIILIIKSEVIGIVIIIIGFKICILSLLKNYLGLWNKKEAKDDINRDLFESFNRNKILLINKLGDSFREKSENILNNLRKMIKTIDLGNGLIKIISNFNHVFHEKSNFFFDNEDLLKSLDNENIKKFIRESYNQQS